MSDTVTDIEIDNAVAEVIGGEVPRISVGAMHGAYDGASRFDRSIAGWSPPMQSADSAIIPHKGIMDSRVEDLSRNDGYIQSGRNLHRDNIVGSMFLLNAKPELKVLGQDDAWGKEFQEEVEAKFTLAAESENCWFDAAGRNTVTGLVRLAVGIYAARGEFLASAEWKRGQRRPFQTCVQITDLDRLSTPWQELDNPRVNGGLKKNQWGETTGGYIRNAHPTDFRQMDDINNFRFVPSRKPWGRMQLIHILEQDRAAQTRGVSEIVAGLKELKITKRFRDITLQNAVVNAMYAASIESELPSEAVFQSLGGGKGPGDAVANYATQYLGAVSEYVGSARNLQIDGVKIPHLFPGTKLQMRPAGNPGGVGQDFEQSLLRYVASILGVSYEQLSKDYSKTNYSSARAAMVETWKFMQSRKKMVADRFAKILYSLWFEEMINTRQLEVMKFSRLPNFYEGLNAEAYLNCDWLGAARGQIDKLKETQAAILAIKSGLSTYEDEYAKMGKDYRKAFAQIQREQKELEEREIVFQESNAINAASGSPREQEGETGA